MAELILTDEEKEAETYLEWDDAALANLVRHTARLLHDEYGQEATFAATAAHLLINMAHKANATNSKFGLKGVTVKGEPIGDWKVEITRTSYNAEAHT